MLDILSLDIINIIYSNLIHPYNNMWYIIRITNRYNLNNMYYYSYRMICRSCLKINSDINMSYIRSNGNYDKMKKSLCNNHSFLCNLCYSINSIDNWSFINSCCFDCIQTKLVFEHKIYTD